MRLGVFCPLDLHPDLGETPGQLYQRAILLAGAAERAGLESFWVSEHHFSAYGVLPDPALLLTAIARHTRALRLGTATAVLPFDHPLRTAERYALCDHLCGGRLEFGVGGGYLPYEYAGFGLDPAERRERFDEALAVIRLAWAGGPVHFTGRFLRVEAPALNVTPLQAGGPPLHLGVTRPAAAPFVGRQGHRLATVPYIGLRSLAELAEQIAAYRAALPAGVPGEVTAALHGCCSADPSDLAAAEAALTRYLRTRVVPGARYSGEDIAPDFVLFGGPAELARRLAALAAIGVDRVLVFAPFGGLADSVVTASLERLGRLVGELG